MLHVSKVFLEGTQKRTSAHLVWQEAVGDVLRGELGGAVQGLISVGQLVVRLIPLPQAQQDLVGLVHRGLGHLDWLETPAQCSIISELAYGPGAEVGKSSPPRTFDRNA